MKFFLLAVLVSGHVQAQDDADLFPRANGTGRIGVSHSGDVVNRFSDTQLAETSISRDEKFESYVRQYALMPGEQKYNKEVAFKSRLDDGSVIATFADGNVDRLPAKTSFKLKDGKLIGVVECIYDVCNAVDSETCQILESSIDSLSQDTVKSMAQSAYQSMQSPNDSKLLKHFKAEKPYYLAVGTGQPSDFRSYDLRRLCRTFKVDTGSSSSGSAGRPSSGPARSSQQ